MGGAGAVTVLLGAPTGPSGAGAASWSQNSAGIPDSAEPGDRFGITLGSLPGAAGVLAIGTPFERIGTQYIGTVVVLPGGPTGPLPLQTWEWTPDLTGLAGTHPMWGDSLGS